MKTLIIGDLHFGARNGNQYILDMMTKFFEEELFPYILNNNISRVIQLGDIFDKRKSIDFTISRYLIDTFFEFFESNHIDFISLSGNHDLYYRQSVEIDGPSQFARGYKHIRICTKPECIDDEFVLVPWVCDENKQEILDFLDVHRNKDMLVFGHFELAGFPIQRGFVSDKGSIEKDALRGFRKVFSGHYHSPSEKGNIIYVGTPYELTWSDCGDEKRFFVYDSDAGTFDAVLTKSKIFYKILYSDQMTYDFSRMKNSYVKVVITSDYDVDELERFLDVLNTHSTPVSVQVVDNRNSGESDVVADAGTISVDDPFQIMLNEIELKYSDNPELKQLVKSLSCEIFEKVQEHEV